MGFDFESMPIDDCILSCEKLQDSIFHIIIGRNYKNCDYDTLRVVQCVRSRDRWEILAEPFITAKET